MGSVRKLICSPKAIAIVKDGNDEIVLQVRKASYEATPLTYPVVNLECIYDGKEYFNSGAQVPAPMKKKRVIFNPPATVVLWEDGTKTVVKCDERDTYDPKYGLALCYMKKALGNTSRALNDILHEEAYKDD